MNFKWTDLTTSQNPKNKFKDLLPVIILAILLTLIPLGIYLVKQPQIFKPKAQELSINMGDGNQDGVIDWADLSFLYSNFFKDKPEIDLNGDGTINSIDYALLIEIFGERGVIKGGGVVEKKCKSDNECLDGYVCDPTESYGFCDTASNCETLIIDGVCRKAEGQSCVEDKDCSVSKGLVCDFNSCKKEVTQNCSGLEDASCPVNYSCIENCGPPVSREGDPPPGYSCARTGTYDPVARKRKNCPICLAANTGISTPDGEVNITKLKEKMKVYSLTSKGEKIISKIIKTTKTAAPLTHKVVHLMLADGRQVWVSPNHPAISGKTVGELKKGDRYDGSVVTLAELVSYNSGFTYDLLPDSETGFYFANGILIASTLK